MEARAIEVLEKWTFFSTKVLWIIISKFHHVSKKVHFRAPLLHFWPLALSISNIFDCFLLDWNLRDLLFRFATEFEAIRLFDSSNIISFVKRFLTKTQQ